MTKVIKGDLVLKDDTTINDDVKVEGNVRCKGGLWDLNCLNLDCMDLNCMDLNCGDLNCMDLNCGDLNCLNLDCRDLDFYAVAIAYRSFKCNSWKARRNNYIIKCLDGEIEIKDKKRFCDKCGQELKNE